MEDLGENITQMLITPQTRFVNQVNDQKDQVINLTVVTQNQGLVPMPVINCTNNTVRVAYSGDFKNDPELDIFNVIYMQDLIDGYNLSYSFNCSYINLDGDLSSCNVGIDDNTQD
jgi:hypothetical protein